MKPLGVRTMRTYHCAFRFLLLFLSLIKFATPLLAQESEPFFLSADSLEKNGEIILDSIPWKYHAGDDTAWASPAYDEHNGWLNFLNVEPRFDNLRSDARYTTLLKKMGLQN